MKKVKELKEEKNLIEAQIAAIEKEITDKNYILFMEELLNLADGVGEGFVEGDYYAEKRYYSKIPGVKNIRYISDYIRVKVTDDSGYLLPNKVTIRDKEYEIIFDESRNYVSGCSY
jgi:predicted RNA-binding protein with PUA domain